MEDDSEAILTGMANIMPIRCSFLHAGAMFPDRAAYQRRAGGIDPRSLLAGLSFLVSRGLLMTEGSGLAWRDTFSVQSSNELYF